MVGYDSATLPWVDRADFAERLALRVSEGSVSTQQAEQLRGWRRDGYVRLPGLVDHALCDALVAEYYRAWEERPAVDVLIEGRGVVPLSRAGRREELTHHHYRFMNFQDVSAIARDILLNPEIVGFLRRVFDEPPVLMQSLLFEYGSEEGMHQDFPYVRARILSHLAGCWIALEDTDADNGPLEYYPGSQELPVYRWPDGRIVYDGEPPDAWRDFEAYLVRESERRGLKRTALHTRKGDVLVWHAALAHAGGPVLDRSRTRLSIVSHYSTREAYPRERRFAGVKPCVIQKNGGLMYEHPDRPLEMRV